jgi:anti-sigma-K factor RskA
LTGRRAHVETELAAYALGALDRAEQEQVRAHLAACAKCAASLAEYQRVADGLLHILPPQPPPPALRDRVRRAVLRAAPRSSRRGWETVYPLLTGLLTVAVLFLSVTAWQIRDSMLQQERDLATLQADIAARSRVDGVALALLSYPDRRVAMVYGEQAYGTVVYEPRIPLVILNAWGLPDLEPGQVFQSWLIQPDGDRVSGGVFLIDSGAPFTRVLLESSEPISSFTGVGVTIEPAGGSPAPTGPNVLQSKF